MINEELKLICSEESKALVMSIADFVTKHTDFQICKSKREANDLHKQGGLYINKERVDISQQWIVLVTKAVWDIPNKSLCPYYLLTQDEYENLGLDVRQGLA